MKARSVQYLPSGEVELISVDVPDPAPDEVQLEGIACGICSWDISTCRFGDKMALRAGPGHEGIGRVRKVGSLVHDLQVGDRVAGGGFQDVGNRLASQCWKIPSTSSIPDHLWLVEPLSCVVTGLDTANLRVGDHVVLVGAGYMGLVLLQLLLRSFAARVVVVDVNADRLALAEGLGAHEVHDLSKVDADKLGDELKALSIDIVFDTTGAQGGLDLATRVVRSGGQINLFGWMKGRTATFDPSLWHLGGLTVVNSAPTARLRDVFPIAIRLLERGMVDMGPLVTHVVGLEDYPALMKRILKGDPTYVKGVVTLS